MTKIYSYKINISPNNILTPSLLSLKTKIGHSVYILSSNTFTCVHVNVLIHLIVKIAVSFSNT